MMEEQQIVKDALEYVKAAAGTGVDKTKLLSAVRNLDGTPLSPEQKDYLFGLLEARGWITYHLADMFDYCSIHDKPSSEQMVDLAQIILTDNPNLNAAEFLLFIFQFKAGKYGRFFGTIDPLVVTTALNDFKNYRREKLIQYRDEEEAIRKQQERDESFERSVPMPGDLNNVRDILRMKDIDTVIISVKNE